MRTNDPAWNGASRLHPGFSRTPAHGLHGLRGLHGRTVLRRPHPRFDPDPTPQGANRYRSLPA